MDAETLFLLAKSQVGAVTVLSVPGAPTTGTWVTGNLALDSNDVLWVCVVGGTPGTWSEATASSAVPLSTVTTKGDLIVATGSGAVTRLAVGTSSQALFGGITPTWEEVPPASQLSGSYTPLSSSMGIAANTATTVLGFSPGTGLRLIIAQIVLGAAASATDVDVWIGTTAGSTSGYLSAITTVVNSTWDTKTVTALGNFTSGEVVYLNVQGAAAFIVETVGQVASGLTGLTSMYSIGVS